MRRKIYMWNPILSITIISTPPVQPIHMKMLNRGGGGWSDVIPLDPRKPNATSKSHKLSICHIITKFIDMLVAMWTQLEKT